MKTKLILTFLAITIAFGSCEKLDELLTFTFKDEATINIPSSSPISLPFEIFLPDVTTNSSSAFENNNTKANLVKDVKLNELKLTITSPLDKTFSFLKAIHIYISTNDNDEIELAYLENIPTDAKTISLTTSGNALDSYIKAESYSLRTQTTIRETLTEDISLKAELEFQVTADPL